MAATDVTNRDIDRLMEFVRESNRIEEIYRPPTDGEVMAHQIFLGLDKIGVDDLIRFVGISQPDGRLRDRIGLDVRITGVLHRPPRGEPKIRDYLDQLLGNKAGPWWMSASDGSQPEVRRQLAFDRHVQYETLAPFHRRQRPVRPGPLAMGDGRV